AVGLYAPRMTFRVWCVVALWIALVIAFNYVKPGKMNWAAGGVAARHTANAAGQTNGGTSADGSSQ
ncbi:MAG TPA: hypothetical protein VNL71_18495, partial [Chloroflexota bacterium]|nr:hypothetical protein [Chloroflexota bacterium]